MSASGTYGGWIKLHRQALENGWLNNPQLWAFWCYCLLKASHKPTKAMVGYQQVPLEAGQFIFGRQQASKDLNLSENTIRTCLARLISTSNLTRKTTNKFSIITIVNWSIYQNEVEELNQQLHQQPDKQGTSNPPATHHIQEVKKERNKPLPTEALRLAGQLADLILQNHPGNTDLVEGKRSSTITRWAESIDKLNRIDKQPWSRIEGVIEWCQRDTFWRANILSGATLRKQWNKLAAKMGSANETSAERKTKAEIQELI